MALLGDPEFVIFIHSKWTADDLKSGYRPANPQTKLFSGEMLVLDEIRFVKTGEDSHV